ncbi:uncharacterized protein LOC120782368 [Bactrocera tryoni]|uniref:uncharacterized protein LOC120782368 n=1 Tax=Bactrocera tryoni TaxID=59916 RepID=UPI001A9759B4|nr:uncharacterized protein LOC120782368 [Bactrocera tryoni]
MRFHLLCLCLIALEYAVITSAEEDPNYKFVFDQIIPVKEDEEVAKIKLEVIRSEDGVKFSGVAEQLVDLDNEWTLNILLKIAEDANGEYNWLMPVPALSVCDFMKFYYRLYIYELLAKYANAPSPFDCPVVKNTYILNEYPLVSKNFKKFLQPGYYQLEVSLHHENDEKIKYIVEGHVEEE